MIEHLLGWMDKYVESGAAMKLDTFLSFTTADVVGEVLFSRAFGFLAKGRGNWQQHRKQHGLGETWNPALAIQMDSSCTRQPSDSDDGSHALDHASPNSIEDTQ